MLKFFHEMLEDNKANILLYSKEIEIKDEPFDIISKKKKVLITGIEGQIGYYVKKEFSDCIIFGLVKEVKELENNIIKIKCNLEDRKELEHIILMIQPYAIIHLAGISCTQTCKTDPIGSININGMIAINICNIIHENSLKTKFFNSSSSEVFKGNQVYQIKDNDNNHKPTHPYSIAKSFSHNMVDWYRKNYNLPFSNGVIFTTESIKRRPSFLTKKCLDHINRLIRGEMNILKLGNLDAYRCFIHALDVAKAIRLIINQEKGYNYNICGDFVTNIKSFLVSLYKFYDIDLSEKDSKFYYKGQICIEYNSNELIDKRPDYQVDKCSIILGDNSKLKSLGWNIPDNIEDFLSQIKELI